MISAIVERKKTVWTSRSINAVVKCDRDRTLQISVNHHLNNFCNATGYKFLIWYEEENSPESNFAEAGNETFPRLPGYHKPRGVFHASPTNGYPVDGTIFNPWGKQNHLSKILCAILTWRREPGSLHVCWEFGANSLPRILGWHKCEDVLKYVTI